MEDHLRSLALLILVTPCFFLAMRFYKRQRKTPDARERLWQRLGIVWAVIVFVVINLSFECFWSTYVGGFRSGSERDGNRHVAVPQQPSMRVVGFDDPAVRKSLLPPRNSVLFRGAP